MSGPTQRGYKFQCRGWEVGGCPVGGAGSWGQEMRHSARGVVVGILVGHDEEPGLFLRGK